MTSEDVLPIVAWLVAGLLAVPAILRIAMVVRGDRRDASDRAIVATPMLLFLVPAHNEEALIGDCVRSLLVMDYPVDQRRIVVVADNCTDATAVRARDAGAEVIERSDPTRPGKPHALAWALGQLPLDRCDAVCIVDADSVVARGFARAVAACSPLRRIAVQGYFGTSNEWDNWLTRLAGLLARARYEHHYPARERAGINVPLTGNGMCVGGNLVSEHGWTAFGLSEDLELYARLTAAGIPIRYARGAHVYSQEASTLRQGRSQRSRWARGRMTVLRQWARPLWQSDRIGMIQKLDCLLELALPGPVLRFGSAVGIVIVALALDDALARSGLIAGALLFVAPDMLAVLAALARHPEPGRTIVSLLMLPPYLLWRLSVGLTSTLQRGDPTWQKTDRNA